LPVTAPPPATPFRPAVRSPVSTGSRLPLPENLDGWMQFCGVMYIVLGGLATLSCFGALVGVPMLLAGLALTGARSLLRDIKDIPAELAPFFGKLKSFVMWIGVIMILYLVGMIATLFIYIGLFTLFGAAMSAAV
jgi:hypothetical protein